MLSEISKIGILTSGGDTPGMNAGIRSFVRSAEFNNIEIIGVKRGFQGLIEGSFDRILASQLGMAALESLKLKKYNTFVGLVNNTFIKSPISEVINATNHLGNDLFRLNKIISR